MAAPSPNPQPSPPESPDAPDRPTEASPSAEADQDIDIAGTEADEQAVGEAIEGDRRRTPAADDPTTVRSGR